MNRQRIAALEKRYHKPGTCLTCGGCQDGIDAIIVTVQGEGTPLGFIGEMGWPDNRRFAYVTEADDPRPRCSGCGRHNGPTLFLMGVYDEREWAELRKQTRAEARAE